MSQPEIGRQVRQHGADIDALYELVEGVDCKVEALDQKLDRRVDALDAKVSALENRVDRGFEQLGDQLSEVLRQLANR